MTRVDLLDQFADANTGRIYRRVLAPRWPVPKRIVVDGDRLRWTWTPGRGWPGITPDRLIEPSVGLLEDFVQLREAPVRQILRYARRWGVLGLCEHDFPAQHPPEYWPSRMIEAHACPFRYDDPYGLRLTRPSKRRQHAAKPSKRGRETWMYRRADFHSCFVRGIYEDGWYTGEPWEPLGAWRTWACRAHALLAVTAALQEGKLGRESDWRMATDTEMEAPKTRDEGWDLVAIFADYWLKAANVRPWPQVLDGTVRLTLGSDWGHSPLFGAIAVQLVLAISGAPGFTVCDACHNVYAPSRTPRAGERHYCQACRDRKVPQLHASARYRHGETRKRH